MATYSELPPEIEPPVEGLADDAQAAAARMDGGGLYDGDAWANRIRLLISEIIDQKVDEDQAAPLADTITAKTGDAASAGTADEALRSDAVIPLRVTEWTDSTSGFPTLPSGFTNWAKIVLTDGSIHVIPTFDTATEEEPPPSGEVWSDDWDRADGAPGNGWTQINGTYSATILSAHLHNAAVGTTNYAGVVRDLAGDVTDATTGTVEVACSTLGEDTTGTALYIACLSNNVSDNVMFWFNTDGVSRIMRYVGGVETTMGTYAEVGADDIMAVHIDPGTDTYTPILNGTPLTPFTSSSTTAWTWRGVFLSGERRCGPFTWTSDA